MQNSHTYNSNIKLRFANARIWSIIPKVDQSKICSSENEKGLVIALNTKMKKEVRYSEGSKFPKGEQNLPEKNIQKFGVGWGWERVLLRNFLNSPDSLIYTVFIYS